jgi:hypothetical protein
VTLGATHHNWRPDVQRFVNRVLADHPHCTANTYVDHPWPGWDRRSVDFWGSGGRGSAISLRNGNRIYNRARRAADELGLRHCIYLHELWTSFGGESYWRSNDHSGRLRHVHVTFW